MNIDEPSGPGRWTKGAAATVRRLGDRQGARRLRAALVTTIAVSGAASAAATIAPAAAASAADIDQCTASPVWGGIGTLTGRDTNISLYAGGDLTVTGPVSETEGLSVVRGDVDLTGTDRAVLFGMVGMGSGLWPHPDADIIAVGGDTRTNPAALPPSVTGNGRVAGKVEGPAFRPGFAAIPDPQVQYELGPAALTAVSPGGGGSPVDYSGFGTRVSDLSAALVATPVTGSTSIGDAPVADITVTAYNGDVSTLRLDDEALVSFTGDGTSALQVFTLDGEALSAYAKDKGGVSFQYSGIPAGASVAINVTGGDVRFAQGWRNIFNGEDVHDPFTTPDGFAVASTAVLFNYAEATSVSIGGGNATEIGRVDRNGNALPAKGRCRTTPAPRAWARSSRRARRCTSARPRTGVCSRRATSS